MKALKLTLYGRTAHFKNPDINNKDYRFSYGHLHRVALLGLFGAILGLPGYSLIGKSRKEKKDGAIDLPGFYKELSHLKTAIVPLTENGQFAKKVHEFSDTTGFSNQATHEGTTMVFKEQWLHQVAWTVYVLLDCDQSLQLADYIINNKSVYPIYFGKNSHFASIRDAGFVLLEESDSNRSDSFIEAGSVKIKEASFREKFDFFNQEEEEEDVYQYTEQLPVALCQETLLYKQKWLLLTNQAIETNQSIYTDGENQFVFM